jgi:hypothetical protein
VHDFFTGSVTNGTLSIGTLIICTICSLVLGFAVAGAYMYRNKYSKSLAVSLVLLPATVQIIIMLVSGNIGAGIAVAGAFSLIRFRSVPGNARDISCLFIAMALGFIIGMGYIFYAFIFLLLVGGINLMLTRIRFGENSSDVRVLRITIPENLDYDGRFDDVFTKYTVETELNKVKTTNMGSLFELTYLIRLKSDSVPKAFMDELRCRNGNLNILISREQREGEEL